MAGPARYTALLDACVLFPPVVADVLMSLHVARLYVPRWSDKIDCEWINAAVRDHGIAQEKLERRRDHMRNVVQDWEVPAAAWTPLVNGLNLPDQNDVHVLAAAIAGHADCIVTANLKDFPSDVVGVHGIEVIHPDDFVVYQLDLDQVPALAAFKKMRARFRNPPRSVDEFVHALERNGLALTAERLRDAAALL